MAEENSLICEISREEEETSDAPELVDDDGENDIPSTSAGCSGKENYESQEDNEDELEEPQEPSTKQMSKKRLAKIELLRKRKREAEKYHRALIGQGVDFVRGDEATNHEIEKSDQLFHMIEKAERRIAKINAELKRVVGDDAVMSNIGRVNKEHRLLITDTGCEELDHELTIYVNGCVPQKQNDVYSEVKRMVNFEDVAAIVQAVHAKQPFSLLGKTLDDIALNACRKAMERVKKCRSDDFKQAMIERMAEVPPPASPLPSTSNATATDDNVEEERSGKLYEVEFVKSVKRLTAAELAALVDVVPDDKSSATSSPSSSRKVAAEEKVDDDELDRQDDEEDAVYEDDGTTIGSDDLIQPLDDLESEDTTADSDVQEVVIDEPQEHSQIIKDPPINRATARKSIKRPFADRTEDTEMATKVGQSCGESEENQTEHDVITLD